MLERRHVIGGAAVTEEMVPGSYLSVPDLDICVLNASVSLDCHTKVSTSAELPIVCRS